MRSALVGPGLRPAGPGVGSTDLGSIFPFVPCFPGSLLLPPGWAGRVRRVVSWCVCLGWAVGDRGGHRVVGT